MGRGVCECLIGPISCVMQSKAATVQAYIASLPADRQAELRKVREVILANLDKAFAETMQYGMIGYNIPHSLYPAGYHCDPKQPLPYAGLASQKNHMSLYLMGLYVGADRGNTDLLKWFQAAWLKTGKKLDMGKACIRFKKADDLALDVLGEAFRRLPAKAYIEQYEAALAQSKSRPAAKEAGTSKVRAKVTPKAKAKPKPKPKPQRSSGDKPKATSAKARAASRKP
jgi:hypothetical protein